jgi:hypothetical protein
MATRIAAPQIDIGTGKGADAVTVPIVVKGMTDIGSFSFYIKYAKGLRVISVACPLANGESFMWNPRYRDQDILAVAWFSLDTLPLIVKDGSVLLNLTFEAGAGKSLVQWLYCNITHNDNFGTEYPVKATGGSATFGVKMSG